jgi:hypothetical protein
VSEQAQVSVRAHFERFPATLKGAFVLRGADGNPHQVKLDGARVDEVAGGAGHRIDLEAVTLDVAPNLDLFVPFEFPTADLGPGWYELICELLVDGIAAEVRPGERFVVAWPRSAVRRGTVAVGKAVAAGGGKIRIEQVECAGDSLRVSYRAEGPVALTVRADGMAVVVLEEAFDEGAGAGRVTAYPALKAHERLSISVKGASSAVEVRLP